MTSENPACPFAKLTDTLHQQHGWRALPQLHESALRFTTTRRTVGWGLQSAPRCFEWIWVSSGSIMIYTVYRWGCSIYTLVGGDFVQFGFFRCRIGFGRFVLMWQLGSPRTYPSDLWFSGRGSGGEGPQPSTTLSRGIFRISRWLLDFSTMKLWKPPGFHPIFLVATTTEINAGS